MLGQLVFLRLKTAEKALREGRLDEAYRLACAPDLRTHHRGAAVLASLAERFIDRARSHFRADRFVEALADLDRAEAGATMQDEIAELRAQVRIVAAEQQRKEQSRHDRIRAVRKRIGDGSLEAGRRLLARASADDHAVRDLQREIEDAAADAVRHVEAAERLISQGHLAGAADRLRRAKKIDAHNEAAARMETKLCLQVFENARSAMAAGRLGRAADELACLGELGDALPVKRELRDAQAVALEAARCLQNHRYEEARRSMLKLHRILPDASWIAQTVKQLQHLSDLNTELLAGPLAEAAPATPSHGDPPVRARALAETVAVRAPVDAAPTLPRRLLLLVDGGGSFLVLRGDQVSVGRSASNRPADIPILGDLAERHANVSRVDEDYFLFCSKEVEVGGRKTKHQLLRDGTRVVFGRRAKLTFRLPSRKSLTAVLDLSDTTKMPHDVRRVILFHRHATIGASRNAHIHCRHATTPLVLFERNGTLSIRPLAGQAALGEGQELRPGEPVEVGGISLVLKPWETNVPGDAKL